MGVWKKYFLIVFLSTLVFSLPIAHAELLNLTYDANGNLVTGDGFYREYNSLNQLWKVYNGSDTTLKLLEYTYDPIEERVLIKDEFWPNGSIRETTYYVSKTQVIVENSSGQFEETYVYHNNQLVAQVDFAGNKEFVLTDHLGSSTVITDENGTVVENSTYAPFGQLITGGSSRYDYEGKEQNEITGELDFNFRTYNPEFGLFTQPDDIIQDVFNPLSLNRFAFEENNPYKNIDRTGHYVETVVDIGFIGYDIYELATESGYKEWENWAALGLDVAGALLPFATGLGVAYRGVKAAGKVDDGVKFLTKATEVSDKAKDVAKVASGSKKIVKITNAYEIAKSGGKHAGMLEQYLKRSDAEVLKGIRSYKKQINTHRDKILNPMRYVDGWKELSKREQIGYLSKWQKDIDRLEEQQDVLRGIMESRKT